MLYALRSLNTNNIGNNRENTIEYYYQYYGSNHRRSGRVSHGRSTASGLHASKAASYGYNHSENRAFKNPYGELSKVECCSGLLHILGKANIEHASANNKSAQYAHQVGVKTKKG